LFGCFVFLRYRPTPRADAAATTPVSDIPLVMQQVSATWNAAYDLGWGTGAIALGVVAAVAGYPIPFAAAALIAFAALPLARRGRR
jgi:predicted MFS family arabinose efflux permease